MERNVLAVFGYEYQCNHLFLILKQFSFLLLLHAWPPLLTKIQYIKYISNHINTKKKNELRYPSRELISCYWKILFENVKSSDAF